MSNQVVPVKKNKEIIKHKTHSGISELHDQVNHLFESFMKGFDRFRHGDIEKMEFSPDFDIVETGNAYDVRAELSGLDEKDVDITLSGNVLSISGEKKEESSSTKGNYHVSERRFGQFERSFTLPDSIDDSKIKATFKKGILSIHIPKKEEAKIKTKKISVAKE
jgi:HSP20 family protein